MRSVKPKERGERAMLRRNITGGARPSNGRVRAAPIVMLANASIQNTTTLQGLVCAALGGFQVYVVASSCPTAGSPLSRG